MHFGCSDKDITKQNTRTLVGFRNAYVFDVIRKEYGNCDYDVRNNLTAFTVYEVPFRSSHALLTHYVGRVAYLWYRNSA